jgi:hypothetical protein
MGPQRWVWQDATRFVDYTSKIRRNLLNSPLITLVTLKKWRGLLLDTYYILEEIVSKSTLLATRPSRLTPKKCINKSIWLAPGRYPWCTHGRCPPLANQIDLFMHFLGASRDGLVARRVDLDTISSRANSLGTYVGQMQSW